jgi:exodeoxyribonuclease V alpha subunit
MTTHMTLRLAWHNDGWNGHVCQKPEHNTYCVGCASYPGEMIREKRDITWEKKNAGKSIADLETAPACMYSASAFSDRQHSIYADPPDFFNDDTERRVWEIPAATACTWPYEAMYNKPDLKQGNGYNYDKRLEYAKEYFEPLQANKSLVFYYANYSNPLSDDENPVYVLIGAARIKQIAELLYYDNCSERTLERYKGFVWQRGITSHYPEQGIRLPYHRYLNKPDELKKFAVIPENSALCKYATRHVTDDDALGLIEQLLQAVRIVRDDLQDDSENWDQRIHWLETLVSELWRSRGAYPGMPAVLEVLGLNEAISGFREKVQKDKELTAVEEIRDFINAKRDDVTGYWPTETELKTIRRNIKLEVESPALLIDVLARCAINREQLLSILDENRASVGISCDLADIHKNPYLLAEQYQGMDASDTIRWSKVDRGMLPSPQLPAQALFEKNAPERIRALLLETLRHNSQQTFVRAQELLEEVNTRIKVQPEWKQNFITAKYLSADKEIYDEAIYQRIVKDDVYLYDLRVWQNERLVQKVFDGLLAASDIQLPRPVGDAFWQSVLFNEQSPLAKNARDEYQQAIESQATACSQILQKRVGAVIGGAGTGKTTILSALIKAIYKVHGEGVSVAVLAPTGKATDRLRTTFERAAVTGVKVATIHSILARYGWLNENLTFRDKGGKSVSDFNVLIIDESSMIDLSLMAALFRAIDWNAVGRLILVGDAGQLPPIGTGKIYADVINHLRSEYPEHLVELTENLRQMENRVAGRGNGILELAACFINESVRGKRDETEHESISREKLVKQLHEGGDISSDLRVVYWQEEENLQANLIQTITKDLRTEELSDATPSMVWGKRLQKDINLMQILSPVRGELYGTESINQNVQAFKSEYWLGKGSIDGITMFDKVIQVVNRPASRPLKGYNFQTREVEEVEIFNGEIGAVVPTGSWKAIKTPYYRLKNFSVQFKGKEHISVNFGYPADKPEGNLELAYAISVHKSQGSEFDRIYFVLPDKTASMQMKELIYTALTRASTHCTVFVQGGIQTLINAMRPEQSALSVINSSLFEFNPIKPALSSRTSWYEAGKIHEALTGDMVRSKSEVIIANLLHERGVNFWYEKPLLAPDGSLYLPDFTIQHRGELYYWEHLGLLSQPEYKKHWDQKKSWYEKHFPGRLIVTTEGADLSKTVVREIERLLSS